MAADQPPLPDLGPDGLPPAEDRPHRPRGPGAGFVLVCLGLLFLAVAFSRGLFQYVDESFGFERLAAAGLAFLFLYAALLGRELGRLRERLLDLVEQFLKVFYGPDFRRERQAVDILIRALRSADEGVRRSSQQHLKRLTGEDFGDDEAAWTSWWETHRSTFRARRQGD